MTKVAFPTEDGRTISRHFGQAPFYVVAALQPGQPTQFEQRSKAYHGSGGLPHSHGHASMFAPISDCQVLISGGMGQPAYDSATASGLDVILTGEIDIRAALDAYLGGALISDPRRIHHHHSNNG